MRGGVGAGLKMRRGNACLALKVRARRVPCNRLVEGGTLILVRINPRAPPEHLQAPAERDRRPAPSPSRCSQATPRRSRSAARTACSFCPVLSVAKLRRLASASAVALPTHRHAALRARGALLAWAQPGRARALACKMERRTAYQSPRRTHQRPARLPPAA